MKVTSLQVADIPPADPRVSSEYINAKFKQWLKRRGMTDPAYAQEYEQATQRRGFSFSRKKKGTK
jgi:hypothetical protein